MKRYLKLITLLLAIITLLSGVSQMIVPGFVLNFIGAENSDTSRHFFAIIGSFMAIFGGLMVHAVYSAMPQPVAVFWSILQKVGAFVFLGMGIFMGIFNLLAVGVALFDIFCTVIYLMYLIRIRDEEA